MRFLIIFIVSLSANADDRIRASREAFKAFTQTETAKLYSKNITNYVERKSPLNKESAVMVLSAAQMAASGSIDTSKIKSLKFHLDENIFIRPDVLHRFNGSETRGILNINISF